MYHPSRAWNIIWVVLASGSRGLSWMWSLVRTHHNVELLIGDAAVGKTDSNRRKFC